MLARWHHSTGRGFTRRCRVLVIADPPSSGLAATVQGTSLLQMTAYPSVRRSSRAGAGLYWKPIQSRPGKTEDTSTQPLHGPIAIEAVPNSCVWGSTTRTHRTGGQAIA